MEKVRDLRVKEKFSIDDAYVNLYARHCGIYASGVYMALCRHANKEQSCFPSRKLMAKELGISERAVFSALKKLEMWQIIKIEKTNRRTSGTFTSNTYLLKDKSVWKRLDSHRHIVPTAGDAEGTLSDPPQANDDMNHRHDVPTKDTQIKETQKKDMASREVFDFEAPIVYLNLKAETRFNPKSKPIERLVRARYLEGRSLEDFKCVIDKKVFRWKNNYEMCDFLRPSTLFNATHFEEYLNEPEPKESADDVIARIKGGNNGH